MKIFFKILAFVFGSLFVWSAVLQYNDPDALLWYGIYGLAALGSLLFVFGRLPFSAAIILCVAYLVGGIVSWPETFEGFEIGAGDIDNIERAREAGGLLIVSTAFLVYALRIWYKRKTLVPS
ncbi:transmembrane 220 family protein [Pricia sp. S334]|uniref:Transmembrane 220 family protein n=1 Tax=Pricia mediterranea TaxID=3076079 RepID=A0ABU3L120_9FLAO|nr:transmembrane 220 family protein [Pricia sp. S334]MDT7827298.1 transmembrane 220 family protein [Pricia sp. S334]